MIIREENRIKFIDKHEKETIFFQSISEVIVPDELGELNHVGGFYEYVLDEDTEVLGKFFEKGTTYEGVFFGPYGYHKKRNDSYFHSSRNKYFRAIFHGKKPILTFKITKICDDDTTMKIMYNEEHHNLINKNAKKSKKSWNGSNGFKQFDEPDLKKIEELAKLIQKAINNHMKGKPIDIEGMSIKPYDLNNIAPSKTKTKTKKVYEETFHKNQVKSEIDADDVTDIRDRVDDYGMEKIQPTVVWEHAESFNNHWICNGHTSLKGLKGSERIEWDVDTKDVLMVSEELYDGLTRDDCKTVNGILNAPEEENSIVGGKTNWKTGQKKIVDMWESRGWTDDIRSYAPIYNKTLKLFKLSGNDRGKAVNGAVNEIDTIKRGQKAANQTKIDYSLNEEQPNIMKHIESLYKRYPKDKSIFIIILTKAMNGNFNKVFDAIGYAKQGMRETLVDNLNAKGEISTKVPLVWEFKKDPDLKPKNIENIVMIPDHRKCEIAKQHYDIGKWDANLGQIVGPGHWVNFKNKLLNGAILFSFINFHHKPDDKILFKDLKILKQEDVVSINLPETRDDDDV